MIYEASIPGFGRFTGTFAGPNQHMTSWFLSFLACKEIPKLYWKEIQLFLNDLPYQTCLGHVPQGHRRQDTGFQLRLKPSILCNKNFLVAASDHAPQALHVTLRVDK